MQVNKQIIGDKPKLIEKKRQKEAFEAIVNSNKKWQQLNDDEKNTFFEIIKSKYVE